MQAFAAFSLPITKRCPIGWSIRHDGGEQVLK
jgi:hypothetical protein